MKRQSGFTLIELVMVIVILGILAVTALPRFVNLSADARAAALQGVVGAINSASSVNFAARSANVANGSATIGLTCTTAANAILEGGAMPTGYTTTAAVLVAGSNTCVVTQTDGGATANAVILGI